MDIVTNVYGPPTTRKKTTFLQNLKYLGNIMCRKRWILGGDFNMILSLEEKIGGIRRLDIESANFNSLIHTLQLIYMENINGEYT
jgi:hypothetical protein